MNQEVAKKHHRVIMRANLYRAKLMKRTIKSFVLRTGRASNRQQQGLKHWLANYLLSMDGSPWNLAQAFGRTADTVVEIGFGMGKSLQHMAQQHPELNFIGIEVHQAGVGSLAADLHDYQLSNVRLAPYDAVEVFAHQLADEVLAGVQIFFPDPWPKKKHHKRRLIQPELVKLVTKCIKPGGFLHCATDWREYAEHIHQVLAAEPTLKNQQCDGGYTPRPATRPLTKFEQRANRLGHEVWDLIYLKN